MPTKSKRPNARVAREWYSLRNAAGTAELYVYDEIGYWGTTASGLVAELSQLTGVTQIDVHINSPGGDVFDGLAIMNCLRAHPAAVTTYVDGIAASIASVIAMAGDTVVMGPHSQMMIHEASGLCIGDAGEMRSMADLLDFQSDNIASVYAERAGGTPESWRAAMVAESWYTAEEAVTAGLADEVAQRAPQTAAGVPMDKAWDLSVFSYAGRDAAPDPAKPAEAEAGAPVALASVVEAAPTDVPAEPVGTGPAGTPATGPGTSPVVPEPVALTAQLQGEPGPEAVAIPDGTPVIPAAQITEPEPAANEPDDEWGTLTAHLKTPAEESSVDDLLARLREAQL
ncbi:head maturation protease, ClpP-related [Streptomyces sp. CA-111067]|uniref:head maturation protease, ClpP-related n=1 Tax=Streptomyces sp. CA-111067 TaxID=3240046 RepID=UPI003D963469